MRRRLFALTLAVVLFLLAVPAYAVTPSDWDANNMGNLQTGHLYSEAAILIDAASGDVLFDKESRVRMYPASTTKIMTLLLALESGIPLDQNVTIPIEAKNIPAGSAVVPVLPGEVMSFQDLLYGFMLRSGNDAANAIAVIVAGDIPAFVERMNARALEMGCTGTNFTNAHGLHDDMHYTTAQDLATITRVAMENETFREIVACPSYTMRATAKREARTLTSRVTMVVPNSSVYYEDCIGVKTGFTNKAGQCFVGAAERDGVILISVALHSDPDVEDQKWYDSARMFEYGYLQYDRYSVNDFFDAAGVNFNSVVITNAAKDDPQKGLLDMRLSQVTDPDFGLLIKDNDQSKRIAVADFVSNSTLTVQEGLQAPIDEGQIIGTLAYTAPDGHVITAMLTATRSVEARPDEVTIYDVLPFLEPLDPILSSPWMKIGLIVLLVFIVILILNGIRKRVRKNRRRQEIYDVKRRAYQRQMAAKRRAEIRRRREEELRRQAAERRRREQYGRRPPQSTRRPAPRDRRYDDRRR